MSTGQIILGVILMFFSVAIVLVVLFQEGHQRNSGVITGAGGDTYLTKHKSRSIDAFLERWTKVISIGFFIALLVVNAMLFFKVV